MKYLLLRSQRLISRGFGTCSARYNNRVQFQPKSPVSPIVDASTGKDEVSIRKIFDDKRYWAEYSQQTHSKRLFGFSSNSSGLFLNPYLKKPSGLKEFANESLEKLKLLVENMITDTSEEASKNYIRNLDRLSDILCRVIDLLEFVRIVHPDTKFVDAAQDCHQLLFQYMNVLNTSSELYERLDFVLKDPKIREQLTSEEQSVGELLLSDFLRSGINMDDSTKKSFVDLSQNISLIGQHFINGVGNIAEDYIVVEKELLTDINPSLLYSIPETSSGEAYRIPLHGRILFDILRLSKNSEVRRKFWRALHQPPKDQVDLLNHFLKYRGILAHLLGYNSFSEYQLQEKMAKNPQNIMSFLGNLLQKITDGVKEELRELAKNEPSLRDLDDELLISAVKPWDREYLTYLYMANKRRSLGHDQHISNYFSAGTVVEGLSTLFSRIYGISLVPVRPEPGETWASDVRKFNAVSESEGVVGVIYLDLFDRPGKTANAAHFTVCCSRKIYPEELRDDDRFRLAQKTVHTSESNGELFQLPVISLVCDFQTDHASGVSLLSLHQLETLFHEMGHAMHSMLGRTNLHNVSGTRCATDFVELPSILMEHFAKDSRVLSMIGKHYETGETIPLNLLENFQYDNNFLKNCEILGQIKMLLLDQLLHSNAVFDPEFDLDRVYHDLEKQLRVFQDLETSWPGKFGHLFSYGSVYYSYLFDRAIASKVWSHLFAQDPLHRSNGERFKNQVLKWGGSRNPWELLANVLDEPLLKKGDEQAMQFIGDVKSL